MHPLTLREIAADVEGNLHEVPDPYVRVRALQFDSRLPERGGLFLCLRGARDGHDFAGQAVAGSAVAVLGPAVLPRHLAGRYRHRFTLKLEAALAAAAADGRAR